MTRFQRFTLNGRDVRKFLLEDSGFLIVGTLCALLVANLDVTTYHHITEQFRDTINEVAMSFFFLIVGKEIREAMLPGGSLASFATSGLPLVATAGGMAGPALLYTVGAFFFAPQLIHGWAIPTATDIAFSYMIARRILGKGHPAITFLLLLAVADDAGGLVILAVFYPQETVSVGQLLAGGGYALLGIFLAYRVLNRYLNVQNFWTYLVIGGVPLWLGFHTAGLHPALALVPLAWCMPHNKSDLGIFLDTQGQKDTLSQMETWFKNPVEIILGIFAFLNAGIELGGMLSGDALVATVLVTTGLVVGKPIGIYLATTLGLRLGLRLPEGVTLYDILVLGAIAGIGFTVAIFITPLALHGESAQSGAKLGALLSFLSVLSAMLLMKYQKHRTSATSHA